MPLFNYRCESCEINWESLVRRSDLAEAGLEDYDQYVPNCPTCERPANKQPAASSFRLLGGGWAEDLYSKK